jgi:hypothetical protein
LRRWAGVDRRRRGAKIDLAVYRRRWVTTMQFDPVIVRLLAEHRPIQQFIERLYCVLLGDAGDETRVPLPRCCRAPSAWPSCIRLSPTSTTRRYAGSCCITCGASSTFLIDAVGSSGSSITRGRVLWTVKRFYKRLLELGSDL